MNQIDVLFGKLINGKFDNILVLQRYSLKLIYLNYDMRGEILLTILISARQQNTYDAFMINTAGYLSWLN